MSDSRDPGVLSRLAEMLIRGPGAEFILTDLDDAMERDLARGIPLWRARWRYAVNVCASAFSLWMPHWRVPTVGVSVLDVKVGLRMLVKHPGMTFVAVFALAVGIPAGLAPMHVINAIQAPLPVDEGDRIQALRYVNVATSDREAPSFRDFMEWREELTSFEGLGATTVRARYNVNSEDGSAAPVEGAQVTASTFDLLRVRPLQGRALIGDDEEIGATPVVVISYELWQSRLNGDHDAVGRAIRLGRVPHTVVGVMPEGFHFPFRAQLWLPLPASALADEPDQLRAQLVFGRLAAGVSPDQAQAELATVGRRMAIEFPQTHARLEPEVVPFTFGLLDFEKGGHYRTADFYVLQMLTLLVLVVACVNVGMLFFARAATRAKELAVRTALGASRLRVVSQLFTEALVFAVLAAGVGLLLADRISSRFDWMLEFLPYWIDLGMTRWTVLGAMSLAVFSAGVVAVVPGLKVTGKAIQRNLQRAGSGRSGVRFGGVSSALLVADVALAVVTVGVAVGISGVVTEFGHETGIKAEQFLSVDLRLPRVASAAGSAALDDGEFVARVRTVQQELVRKLAAEPGVRNVAVASVLPGMDHPSRRMEVDGEDQPGDFRGHRVVNARVDVDFFNALEQQLVSGRDFGLDDLGEGRSAVIVNTDFVNLVFGGGNALGRRVRYKAPADELPGPWYEIVGVVGQLGMYGSTIAPGGNAGLYHPVAAGRIYPLRLAIHVGDDPELFTPRLRALASTVDATAIVERTVVLSEANSFSRSLSVWVKWGAGILTGILIALSASGIYSLMSFTVVERTREIGIRTAVGAQRSRIVWAVAKRSFAQLGVGLALGMIIAGRFLFEVQRDFGDIPTDSPFVATLLVGMSVLIVIGMIGCVAPTMRALRIMPTEALRSGE